MSAGLLYPDARRALALLAACGERGLRRLLLVVYAGAVLAAVAGYLWLPKPDKAPVLALAVLALAAAFVWMLWCSRIALVVIDARASRMPGLHRDALAALVLAFAATVALPMLVLTVAGANAGLAFGALACAALLGLLFALLPGWVAMLVGVTPALTQHVELPVLDLFTPSHLMLLALATALAAVLRWRAITRNAEHMARPSLMRPMVLGLGRQPSFGDGMFKHGDFNRQLATIPAWMLEIGRVAGFGPRTPITAMRAWLGAPFAPLAWPQRLRQLTLVLGSSALFPLVVGTITDKPGALWAAVLASIAVFGGLTLTMQFPLRLVALTQRHAGELAELALLPGWGGADRARGTLLRAVAWPPAVGFAGLLAMLLIAAPLSGGIDRVGYTLMLVITFGLVLMTAVASLRPLAGKSVSLVWLLALLLVGLPLMIVSVFAVSARYRAIGGVDGLRGLFTAWAVIYAFLGVGAVSAWRRFRVRPHPFLQH